MRCDSSTDSTVWMEEDQSFCVGFFGIGKSIGNFFQIVQIWRNFFMTNTRKLAYIAILSAISFLLLYFSFPLIPAADFLKVDFSILPVLIALVIFDFKNVILMDATD